MNVYLLQPTPSAELGRAELNDGGTNELLFDIVATGYDQGTTTRDLAVADGSATLVSESNGQKTYQCNTDGDRITIAVSENSISVQTAAAATRSRFDPMWSGASVLIDGLYVKAS
jgi:hypothetical protein